MEIQKPLFAGHAERFLNYVLTSAVARSVRKESLTYLTPLKMRRLEKTVSDVLKGGVAGDVAEFGIALGGSAIVLAWHARHFGRKFHGFDVFGMIPPPASDKDGADSKTRYEMIASGQSEGLKGETYYGYRHDLYGEVCRSFARYAIPVDGSTVQLHKGTFAETISVLTSSPVAFAHVDCDWYDPVRLCLSEIAKRSSVGTAIVIDDYHDWTGCRQATDEFISAHPGFAVENGPNLILKRVR
jgi:asparagine synthase (glutamine-hydrolysing)